MSEIDSNKMASLVEVIFDKKKIFIEDVPLLCYILGNSPDYLFDNITKEAIATITTPYPTDMLTTNVLLETGNDIEDYNPNGDTITAVKEEDIMVDWDTVPFLAIKDLENFLAGLHIHLASRFKVDFNKMRLNKFTSLITVELKEIAGDIKIEFNLKTPIAIISKILINRYLVDKHDEAERIRLNFISRKEN